MTEKTLEKKLREKIKTAGGLALKFYSPSFTGMPDRIVLLPGGKIYFVELKSTGEKTRLVQNAAISQILKLGFMVFVIDSNNKLNDFLKGVGL